MEEDDNGNISVNLDPEEDFTSSDDYMDDDDEDTSDQQMINSESNITKPASSMYSGIDDVIPEEILNKRPYQALIKTQDVSSHLKGSLAFGLAAKKANGEVTKIQNMRINSNSNTGGLLVHRPVVPRKKEVENIDHLSEDLKNGYRILAELMSDYQKATNSPFMDEINLDSNRNRDYLEVISKPIWLRKIKEKLLGGEYETITELVADIRLMLENAYTYYGPVSTLTKKGLRLEHMLEQKLALLPKDVKDLCTLEKTSGQPIEDLKEVHRNKCARISVNGDNYFSHILHRVRGHKAKREKELKQKKMEHMRLAKRRKELEIIQWEDELLAEPLKTHMHSMWELVQIGHFIFLILKTLNINEVPQYELERMLLMPEASSSLRMLMTSLLSSPQNRLKLSEKPYMPYKTWARKLASKTVLWYRCYYRENQDSIKVFDQMGIEPQFWTVCGESNPFDKKLFHEMSFYQRVWMLKTLCDFLLHNQKTIQDVLAEQNEADLREYILGTDRDGNQYIHFPQFCGQDLRVYCREPFKTDDFAGRKFDDENKDDDNILPKEKVKQFKKMMKKLRKAHEKDGVWYTPHKVKKKRGKKHKHRDPMEVTEREWRSRPSNLRQRPRASYKEDLEEVNMSTDEDDVVVVKSKAKKKKKKKKRKKEKSDNESDSEEEQEHRKKRESKSRSQTPTVSSDLNDADSIMDKAPEVSRAQQKNPRLKKTGKKKAVCEICGKTFNNVSALKGHRAIHTKEKIKQMKSRESTPVANLPSTPKEPDTESNDSNSANTNSLDADAKPNTEEVNSVTNGNSDTTNDIEKNPLVNGIKKDEDSDSQNPIKTEENIKTEVKDEPMSDAEEEKPTKENEKCDETEVKKEEIESEVKQEEDIPTPCTPNVEAFRLVCSSLEELRTLLLKFGDLPPTKIKEKKAEAENAEEKSDNDDEDQEQEEQDKEEEDEEEKEDSDSNSHVEEDTIDKPNEKRPHCEVKLHKALCKLLVELLPWENKLILARKRMRNKIRNEYLEWQKKGPDYVDPAEEIWASDPEPEPETAPSVQPTPDPSSSSSEASLDEDGVPKRKLRKRRAKRNATPIVETHVPASMGNSGDEKDDSFTVSSRGRVRRVKKIYNYDNMDFDKLANQAKEEERDRKKRKREDAEEQQLQEPPTQSDPATTSCSTSSGVKRYLLSKSGQVMGFIDNKGTIHSGSMMKDNTFKENVTTTANTPTVMSSTEKQPTVVVAAINDKGAPVYVRVVGNQVMQLLKYMNKDQPVTQIKLQHYGLCYTVNSNAHISFCNVPGYANNSPTKTYTPKPLFTQTPVRAVPKSISPSPFKNLNSNLMNNNQTPTTSLNSIKVYTPPNSTPNTIALAYRGIPSSSVAQSVSNVQDRSNNGAALTSNTNLVSAIPSLVSSVSPYQATPKSNTTVPKKIVSNSNSILFPTSQNNVVSMQSNDKPSNVVVKSAIPDSPSQQSPASNAATKLTTQIINKPINASNLQPVQMKVGSESLVKLIQNAGGNKIVAVPNGKGGYTLSMTPINVSTDPNAKQEKDNNIPNNMRPNVPGVINIRQPVASISNNIQIARPQGTPRQQIVQIRSVSQNNTPKISVEQNVNTRTPERTMLIHQKTPEKVTLAQPTRYVLQPQVLNEGVAPNLTSQTLTLQQPTEAKTSLKQNIVAIVPSSEISHTNSPQKAVYVGSSNLVSNNQQRIITTALQPQQISASPQAGGITRAVLINPQGQQYIRLPSNSVIQQNNSTQPVQQIIRLQQPLNINNSGVQKLVQVIQPGGGRQVLQMVQQINSSQAAQIIPQAINQVGTTQIFQSINNSVINQIQPQGNVQVHQIQPQSNVQQVHQIQPQSNVQQVQQIQPQSNVQQVQQIQPQSNVQVQQIQPQSNVQVQQIQPQSNVQVQQIQQSNVQVQQIQQNNVQHIQQLQPQSSVQNVQQIQFQQQSPQVVQVQPRVQVSSPQVKTQLSTTIQQAINTNVGQGNLVLIRTNQGERVGVKTSQGLALLSQEQLQALNIRTNVQ